MWTVLAPNPRVFRPLGKEVLEGCLQMSQRLLLRDARRFPKPREFRVFPVDRPSGTAGVIVDWLAILKGIGPKLQSKVVGMSGATEIPRQLTLLTLSGVEAKCLSYLHKRSTLLVRRGSIPNSSQSQATLKGTVSDPGELR
jgi:hypothetical protein